MNPSPIVNTSPNTFRNPVHPVGVLMEATIEARDADPFDPKAAPVPVRRRPFVMTADGEKQEEIGGRQRAIRV
jgi:hypothetical protein